MDPESMEVEVESPQPPNDSAWPQVEAVAELMELVLLELPLQEIIVAERVSKRWQTLITKTPSIQKALFRRPTDDVRLRLVEDRDIKPFSCSGTKDCNPRRSCFDHPRANGCTRWGVTISDEKEYRIMINPLLGVENPFEQEYFQRSLRGRPKVPVLSSKARRADASWRRMLFAQPPLQEIMARHGDAWHWHVVKAKDEAVGLTMGDVDRSRKAFGVPVLRAIWGEDGFSRGVPVDSPASAVIEQLGVEPAEEKFEEERRW